MTPSAINGGLAAMDAAAAAVGPTAAAAVLPGVTAPSTPSHGAAGLSADEGDESHGSSGGGGGGGGGGGSSSSANKRKRVVLSIHEKQQVLHRLDAGEQPVVIARHFGISRQQVSDIKKNKERILSFCVDAKHVSSLRRKTLKATSDYHPGVEQELYRWIIRQRRLNRAVSSDALTNKATDLFMQYSAEDSTVSFKTITNWLRHFKRAHGIKMFNEEELAKLPERFVPSMDMSRALASANNNIHHHHSLPSPASSSTIGVTTNNGMGLPPSMHMNVDDYINGMSNMLVLHANPQQHHDAAAAATGVAGADALKHPLMAAVNTIHELSAQLSYFEREMAIKLDYLDARVEKLCFTMLPPRFA
uniref:HTH CENPB-type domain-containing protein n=1 Tax=Globisporangium ultimum (strain ATCC 200006 / CBS 805.95 / DAOM BR144) TaxID=431595 RepID=K3WLB7_GLOUD